MKAKEASLMIRLGTAMTGRFTAQAGLLAYQDPDYSLMERMITLK